MTEENENKIEEIKGTWENLESIFSDGKVDVEELPLLLKSVGLILNLILGVLSAFGIDPKINLILSTISTTFNNLSVSLKNEIPQIKASWVELEKIMEDEKIDVGEVKGFILALSNLMESVVSIILPFVNVEFSDGMLKLGSKLQRLIRWFEDLEKLKIGD